MSRPPRSVQVPRPPRMFNRQQDLGGIEYLVPTRALTAGAQRYRNLLDRAAVGLPGLTDANVAACCALLLFENPGSQADLRHMTQAAGTADMSAGPVLVYWHRNGALYCRELSEQTRVLVARSSLEGYAVEDLMGAVRDQLKTWYDLPRNAAESDLFDWIVNDGLAWAWNHQYRPIVADLGGAFRIEPLPARVIARATRHALSSVEEFRLSRRARNAEKLSDAIVAGLVSGPTTRRDAYLVGDLVDAFSARAEGEPRASNHQDTVRVFRALAQLAGRLPHANPAVAFTYGWTLFMLTDGTARTRSGNVKTVRAYCGNLARDLFEALLETGAHPLELIDSQWSAVVRKLLTADQSETRRSAVSALLKYLRGYFGAEIGMRPRAEEPTRHVSANVIWQHELSAALELLEQVEEDERLRLMVRGIYDLARRVPLRYGDLTTLRLRSIRKLKVGDEMHLELEIAPPRSLHAGKSRAARRVERLGLTNECAAVMALLERRGADGAGLDDLLLGDPRRADRLYRAGRLAHLVHGLLKSATGDAEVSFHTLRHTILTSHVSRALREGDIPRRQLLLDKAAEAAGQKSPRTTLEMYFHVPWQMLRRHTDLALRPFLQKASARRAWSMLMPSKHSTQVQELPPTAADLPLLLFKWAPSPARPRIAAELSLDDVRGALCDIQSGRPFSEICSRSGLSDATMMRLVIAAERVATILLGGPKARALGLEDRGAEQALGDAAQALEALPISFVPNDLPCHAGIWQRLSSSPSAGDALAAWLRCYEKGWLSLREESDYEPLVSFLAKSKVPPTHLELRYAEPNGEVLLPSPSSEAAKRLHAAFGVEVCQRTVKFRRGRPLIYLIVARDVVLSYVKTPAASCRMHELHGAFMASAVRSILLKSD